MAEPGLALLTLFDGVEQQFTDDNTQAPSTFGWREANRYAATNRRLVWVPGDDKSKDRYNAGKIVAASKRRLNATASPQLPRHLADFLELCTVYVHAADVTNIQLERAQYAEAWLLFGAFYRAVYRCAVGNFEFRTIDWVTTNNENRFGAAVRVVLEMRAAIPDCPLGPTGPEQGDLIARDVDTVVYDAEMVDAADPPNVIHTIPTITVKKLS